ncbi:4-hydroxy-tetrahydrodipicolinate synthase [Thalassotalea euphylliae]|uniref:4-hydroxy-tetrahydrodipicolinate synthase n=1 Tax=Thalassotalea euphylliae TaxID=1655234 RepID=A0A3E0TQG4_9GAMM|nr:4-hydroxy-tetrahydrodipicolinate synthase [Thalassotalea euphylliae]REL26738.1 4-hydroxy-tetrahydrodipicolinate synthase [Thalassotalea euphylliae]
MFTGSIVALVTPFDEHEQIDFAQVANLIDWHISQGTSAIVIAGTTGESATLSDEDVIALARFSATHNAKYGEKRIAIIAGNGCNCTRRSVALTKQLNTTGIDGFLTVTPYYNKPSIDGLMAHYRAINNASQLPILLYNVPSRTGCDLPVSLVAKLAELSQVCGIKDATAELARIAQYRQLCEGHFILLSGDDESATEFCKLGGDGVISVTANLVPGVMAQIQQFIKEEKYQQAELLDQQLAQLHKNLFVESNPIPVKWAMQAIKRLPNAKMRLPLCPLSTTGQQLVSATLADLTQHFQEY